MIEPADCQLNIVLAHQRGSSSASTIAVKILRHGADAVPDLFHGFFEMAARSLETLRPILNLKVGLQPHLFHIARHGWTPGIEDRLNVDAGHGLLPYLIGPSVALVRPAVMTNGAVQHVHMMLDDGHDLRCGRLQRL